MHRQQRRNRDSHHSLIVSSSDVQRLSPRPREVFYCPRRAKKSASSVR
jgi:hypothetical protein